MEKYKNALNNTKNENEEVKQNITKLKDALKLNNQKNNNDNFEKNELNLKVYE